MRRHEMLFIYDELKKLEKHLKKTRAPQAIVARARDALLAVSWGIDHGDDE